MNLDKFLKILWLINGIGLLVLLLVVAGIAISEIDLWSGLGGYDSYSVSTPDKNTSVQLTYSEPEPIYGTGNYLLAIGTGGQYSGEAPSSTSYYEQNYYASINIIFLDKNLSPTKTLLNKKAHIQQFTYPSGIAYQDSDTTAKNIVYLIAMSDSNNDGNIDYSDDQNLYISDLSGNNFKQITHNLTISNYAFIQNGQKLRIDYLEKDDAEGIRHFALYHIAEDKLDKLSALDASLNSIKTVYKP